MLGLVLLLLLDAAPAPPLFRSRRCSLFAAAVARCLLSSCFCARSHLGLASLYSALSYHLIVAVDLISIFCFKLSPSFLIFLSLFFREDMFRARLFLDSLCYNVSCLFVFSPFSALSASDVAPSRCIDCFMLSLLDSLLLPFLPTISHSLFDAYY